MRGEREEAGAGASPVAGAAFASLREFGAAILAGGEGRRLGGLGKEGLIGPEGPLGPALARRLGRVFGETLVVTKRPEFYAGLHADPERIGRLTTCADLKPGFGPLSGLHAALTKAASAWIYLAACDMPAFSPEFAAYLAALVRRAEEAGQPPLAALARFGGHFEPFHAYYSRALLPRLEALFAKAEGETGPRPSFKALFENQPVLYLAEAEARRFSPDWGLFFNINTPEELERLRKG